MNRWVVLFLLFIILTTCQSFSSSIKEPVVSLNSVDIAGISFKGVDLIAHVDVENPNGFSIPLPKIDWELFVNSALFIQGEVKNDKTISSRRKVTLDLPLSFTYDGLYKTFTSLIAPSDSGSHEAAYDIAVDVTFPIPVIEDMVYKLGFSGVLPLPQLPKLSSGSVQVSRMDYSTLVLACEVDVENPNVFPIPFPEISCDYGINGISVLKNSDRRSGEIPAGAVGAANFDLNITYADIFMAVDSARNANEVKSNLSLAARLPISAFEEANVLDIPGTIPILQKPDISFQGITKGSLGRTMEFILYWEVDNKNNFAYDIGEFFYDFSVNNKNWARGQIDNPPRIRAGGKTIVPVTVLITSQPIVTELAGIISLGSAVNYDCTGNVSLLGGITAADKLELPLNLQGSTRIR
jgi:LEA14-like dessication related protein